MQTHAQCKKLLARNFTKLADVLQLFFFVVDTMATNVQKPFRYVDIMVNREQSEMNSVPVWHSTATVEEFMKELGILYPRLTITDFTVARNDCKPVS